ncbi:uncharacterized protein LOC116848760 isoform X2 [Odontomachus brunneus]|uniref:uncharacterized protein LOC116848760 isoform X2 n=1 Tax=Odontomachus brunneus TaxID=486640 RepID=UPI0013F1D7F3|nr:uncharacterized protein LOC116848760 isoform X2 [Odontomachus brunneus]
MNIFFLVLVVCMVLFANAIEISKEDKAEMSSKKESPSQWQLNGETSNIERSVKINRGFEKIVQFVNVLGQMDNFFYDKTKNLIRKLNVIYDMDENERYRRTCFNS